MGTNKLEKRSKKTKKIKNRGCELVANGESPGAADFPKCDVKDDATDINENIVPAEHVKVKAHKSKRIRNSKKKNGTPTSNEETNAVSIGESYEPAAEEPSNKGKKDKSNKINKNKRKRVLVSDVQNKEVNDAGKTEQFIDGSKRNKDKLKRARKDKTKDALVSSEQRTVVIDGEEIQPTVKDISTSKKGKLKKTHKQRKATHSIVTEPKPVQEVQVVMEDVYQISSGEDDDSKGMKKWIKEYHERRPGMKVLQDRIDDFITTYEEKEEQANREKQENLAEDGWTVVVHRKGGKKTTDSESGVSVGSVAEAAVREKLAMKKSKDVGLDFYRFQRKEANRSGMLVKVMMVLSWVSNGSRLAGDGGGRPEGKGRMVKVVEGGEMMEECTTKVVEVAQHRLI
ncbi:hypothetical protein KSS87_015016 [Heliosperma pusillum]|nr:hypothetical protein KSS87_015016 [Heliosperma pusillum]